MSKKTAAPVTATGPIPLSPRQLAQALKTLIPAGRPIWIHGRPGVGKTSIVRQVCQEIGYDCPHFPPAVTLDPVDLRGIPSIDQNTKQTVWRTPNFWPADPAWKGVIFVDELPQADKTVQSGFMQLTYGGRLGDYQLPDKATIVVCGNRQQDRAGTNRVITPLLNRFVHLGLEVSPDDWYDWAARNVHGVIRSFIRFKPECFDTFDPSISQTAFASPRTWEIASDIFKAGVPSDLLHAIISGCVGTGPATEFCTFADIYGRLPDVDAILKDPANYAVPSADEPSVLFALCGALADRVKKGTPDDQIKAFATYVPRLPDEFAVLAMRDGVSRNPKIVNHAGHWLKTHHDVLLPSGDASVPA